MSIFSLEALPGTPADPLAEFRATCREMGGQTTPFATQKITAIGVYFDDYGSLSERDAMWLRYMLECCEVAKTVPSPNSDFRFLNIEGSKTLKNGREQDFYNAIEDFLNPALVFPTDFLFVCYVYNAAGPRPVNVDNLGYSVSPYHFDKSAWRNAALRSNAEVIVTAEHAVYHEEITTSHFDGPEYRQGPTIEHGIYKVRSLIRHDRR